MKLFSTLISRDVLRKYQRDPRTSGFVVPPDHKKKKATDQREARKKYNNDSFCVKSQNRNIPVGKKERKDLEKLRWA